MTHASAQTAQATAETPPVQCAEARVVVVRRGDTLGQIARRAYGDSARAFDIAQANGVADPNLIHVGQALRLPAFEPLCVETEAPIQAVFTPTVRYAVLHRRTFDGASRRTPDQRLIIATSADTDWIADARRGWR